MTTDTNAQAATPRRTGLAVAAVICGAVAMGISPAFVRLADVGPLASAFWRVSLAIPFLWIWATLEDPGGRLSIRDVADDLRHPAILAAGALFAGDLIFWHLSIVHTTIANATFMATLAPVWVALTSGLLIKEHVPKSAFVALAICLAGAAALIGSSVAFSGDRVLGDIYGLITSVFFGVYFLAVRVARRTRKSGRVLLSSTIVTAVILLPVALAFEDALFPGSVFGLAMLVCLALLAHTGGQGLLAWALGYLPAAFTSLVIFIEAVTAAAVGWLLLSESLTILQVAGGCLILIGVFYGRPRRNSQKQSAVHPRP